MFQPTDWKQSSTAVVTGQKLLVNAVSQVKAEVKESYGMVSYGTLLNQPHHDNGPMDKNHTGSMGELANEYQ